MIQFNDIGETLETREIFVNVLECIAELDERKGIVRTERIDEKRTIESKCVEARLEKEKIGSVFDWQEARTGYFDTVSVVEAFDGSASSSFELDNSLSSGLFLIDDDVDSLESRGFNDTLDGIDVDPKVVGVKDLEFFDGFEFLDAVGRNLSEFKKSSSAIVFNQSTTFDVCACFRSDFHDEFRTRFSRQHMVEETKVNK